MSNRSALRGSILVVIALSAASAARAQEADVKAVIEAEHAAIAALDATRVSELWAHDADVALVNPLDKTVAVGWEAVKARWAETFSGYVSLEVTQAEGPHIVVAGDTAWAVGTSRVVRHVRGEPDREATLVESDVLRKQDGRWRFVAHVAKRI